MQFLIVLSALVALAIGQATYSTENDALDIAALVSNPELLKNWNDCLVDKGPCNEAQSSAKANLGEAVAQACAKCTAAQKTITRTYIEGLKKNAPAEYDLFKNKYDPEDKYLGPLMKAIA